jgi:glutamate N-acetyltransferase/amino-acid N-acetyltransferase
MTGLPPLDDTPLKEAPEVDDRVAGFAGAAAAAGLRKDGRVDLALIAAEGPVPAAGVFTTNKLPAAPVQVCRRHLASGYARAILANSGGANAATGEPGIEACLRTCRAAAKALSYHPHEVLPCSTGVIGQLLDAGKVEAVLPELAAGLAPDGIKAASEAIMTTDAFHKMARAEAMVYGKKVAVLGLAKGAGMIRPDMATMLAFVLTDAAAGPEALKAIIGPAAEQSFNRASVDGDTSTNDTLLMLASGKAGNPWLTPGDHELAALAATVTKVCQELAAMLVADGEGAGHLIRVRVTGAPTVEQARATCYAVAHSPLCKTAFAGRDPNWGRLFSTAGAEAGRRGWPFAPERFSLWIGEALLAREGLYTGETAEQKAAAVMKRNRYEIRMELGLGAEEFWVLTNDLDHEYIRINADYRS